MGAVVLHQVKVDGDLGQSGEEGLESGSLWKEKLAGFARSIRDREERESSHILVLSSGKG